MADAGPQKLNAAQLAQRNIKPLRKRRPGGTPGPSGDSVPQFADPNAPITTNGGGGLFGGGIQGPGGFNFSANVPTINFGGAPSFGVASSNDNSSQGSDSESEGARKRNRPFQINHPAAGSNAQSTNPFQFDSAPTQPSAPSSGFSFGSSNTTEKPANSLFSFGQTAQPQTSSQAFNLGSASTQDQPANNPFSFGQSQQQSTPNSSGNIFSFSQASQPAQQPASPFNFGANQTADKPTSNSFSFGQTQSVSQSPSSSTLFSATAGSETVAGGGFNFGQPSSPTHNTAPFSFSSAATQPAASTTLFNKSAAGDSQLTNSGFSFSATSPSADSNNLFQFNSTPTSPSLFGQSTSQDSIPNTNIFGQINPPMPTANSIFSSSKVTDSPDKPLFGSQAQQPAPSSNIFADSTNKSSNNSNNIFRSQQQEKSALNVISGNQGIGVGTGLGNQDAQIDMTDKGPEAKLVSDVFGANNETGTPPKSIFGDKSTNNNFAPSEKASSNLFDNMAQSSAKTNIFSNINKTPTSSTNIFGNANGSTNALNTTAKPSETEKSLEEVASTSPIKSSASFIGSELTNGTEPPNTQSAKPIFNQSSAMTNSVSESSVSNAFKSVISSVPTGNIFSSLKPLDALEVASNPAPTGMFPNLPQSQALQPTADSNSHTTKSSSFWDAAGSPKAPATSFPFKEGVPGSDHNPKDALDVANVGYVSDELIKSLTPSHFNTKQRIQFDCGVRLQALNVGLSRHFASFPLGADFTPLMEIYNSKRIKIKRDYEVHIEKMTASDGDNYLKRKVDDAEDSNNTEKQAKRSRNDEAAKQTLFSPLKANTSPAKATTFANNSTTPKIPPPSTSSLFVPQQPEPRTTPAPKSKRKAEFQITKDGPTQEEMEKRSMKTPKLNGASGGSQTSNIFRNILESPDNKSLPPPKNSAVEETQRQNPFASLPVPSTSPTKPTASSTSNIFSNSASTSNIFAQKPALNSPAPNLFAPKTSSPLASSTTNPTSGFNPPVFATGPVNFLAQFGQKASKDSKDSEAKAMEKAKMEDMDSDEDEAEWEAKYKAKREAEKKATDEASQGKRASFVPGKGFSFSQTDMISEKSNSSTKSASSIGANIFASISGSRGSSPDAVSSPSGSVLDAHVSGKPVSFDTSNNIFGHLSDAESARSSKGNEADDDETEEDDEEGEDPKDGDYTEGDEHDDPGSRSGSVSGANSTADADDYKRDPNYDPKKDQVDRSGTPVEETGAGIASARKNQGFFTSKQGTTPGTTTPASSTSGGSLFDRISKDSNGNPIRQIPAENKENSGPAPGQSGGSNSVFSNFMNNKSPGDNTWKQDSPIKFGAPSTAAPSFSFTAASPTPSPFSPGLFGSTAAPKSPSPFAGLFGNTGTPKTSSLFSNIPNPENKSASVGFQFGAPSTTTSSLFPSAVASTATSRATSPGITTDGESANDENADPDAEKHEQIDLTKGGAGEEDESILHEVRAKALKFAPSQDDSGKGTWETRGIGFLRILQHTNTGATRILLRADPSGAVLLNKGLLANVTYKAQQRTVTVLTAGDGGKGLETYLLQVKTADGANELASIMEANKPKS